MTLSLQKWGIILLVIAIALFGILTLVKINVDERGAFLCKVVAANPALSMDDCPAHKDDTSWLLVVAFGISFLVFGAGIYLLFTPREKKTVVAEEDRRSRGGIHSELYPKPRKVIDFHQLSTEEQKLYLLLQENNGSLYQSDLVSKTGFSKVQVTRILDRMEGAGIIERKRRGMTNVVILQ